MGFFSVFFELLFPPKCIFCRRVFSSAANQICADCRETLPCAPNDSRQSGEFFKFCVSPLYYKDSVRKSILRFKFNGKAQYADPYGELLADCIRENLDGEFDIISWVPLSRDRKKSRGYDQAMLLALSAALALDNVAVETLIKVNDVRAQSSINDKRQRRDNISGAYMPADIEIIAGKRVLLIDDVITTGSTLSECAKVLLNNGASSVVCATLARCERD